VILIRAQGKEPVILAVALAFYVYWRPPNTVFFLLRVFTALLVLYSVGSIPSFTCTNTAAFNFTDLHGNFQYSFIFMQRAFTLVCIPWIQAAEVLFNNHTAVMPVTLLLTFIVMAYQSPTNAIIRVRAGYLYFALPLFAAAHFNSPRHCRREGIVN